MSCIVELINASALDHVQPITPVDTSLVDRRLRCQLINLAHIRHDRIPAVRASGGPLYQKSRRMSPDRLSWRRSRNNMAVWLRETSLYSEDAAVNHYSLSLPLPRPSTQAISTPVASSSPPLRTRGWAWTTFGDSAFSASALSRTRAQTTADRASRRRPAGWRFSCTGHCSSWTTSSTTCPQRTRSRRRWHKCLPCNSANSNTQWDCCCARVARSRLNSFKTQLP